MTKEQAVDLIAQVLAIYKGTLQEHEALQLALKTVRQALDETEQKKLVKEVKK